MKTKIIYTFLLATLISFISCENLETNPTAIDNSAPVLIGEWDVVASIDDITISEPFKLLVTGDLRNNSDSIILKDISKDFWNFQLKVAASEDGTLDTQMTHCDVSPYNIGVIVSNGAVINSDSIYLEVQFEDDEQPYLNTYQLKGRRASDN